MRIYRRKMYISVLLFGFLMIMAAGSAFAFATSDSLIIEGRASVDMRLRQALDITNVTITSNTAWGAMGLSNAFDAVRHVTHDSIGDRRYVSVSYSTVINDINDSRSTVRFEITNRGETNLLITDITTVLSEDGINEGVRDWGFDVSHRFLSNTYVLSPGEVAHLAIEITFNPDFETWDYSMINSDVAHVYHTTILRYELAL